jgi:uncharacterized membrane protein
MYLSALAILEVAIVAAGLVWRFRRCRMVLPQRAAGRGRAAELGVLAALTLLAPAAVARAPTSLRMLLGSCALLLAPGAALLTFWPVRDVLDRLLLTVVLSGAVLLLLSMLMLWTGLWSPLLLVHLVAATAAPILAWRALDVVAEPASGPPVPSAEGVT